MTKYILIFITLLTAFSVNAQSVLKGTVYDNGNNTRLTNVFIHDNAGKQLTITDDKGNFSVRTEPGHILIFDSPGYVSDTLYVSDMIEKKVLLISKTIALREVSVNASRTAFDPRTEYPDVYTKSKVYVLSPTSWFSKEGKDARKLKRYFQTEAEERHVDGVYTRAYVGSIVPLKGQQLEDFMTMYRPSYAFLRSNSGESLVAYINDSYKKYQALPADKRGVPKLTSQ